MNQDLYTKILILGYLVKKLRSGETVILNDYEREFILEILERELKHIQRMNIRIKI